MNLSLSEKRTVGRHVRAEFAGNPRDLRFAPDGAVTAHVDRMPNTDRGGRIFCGWDTELLAERQLIEGDWSPEE